MDGCDWASGAQFGYGVGLASQVAASEAALLAARLWAAVGFTALALSAVSWWHRGAWWRR